MHPSRANPESRTGDAFTIPPRLTLPSRQKISLKDIHMTPAAEEVISSLDTAPMFVVRRGESQQQRHDTFINAFVEDIALQATLRLPVIRHNKDQVDQHRDITAVAGSAAISGIGDICGSILRYITNIVMTHMFSPAIYGIFGEVYTAAMFLGWLADWGFGGLLAYLVPAYRVKDQRSLVGGIMRFATWITLISSLLAGMLFFAFAAVIARVFYHNPSYELPLQEVALLIPLMAFQMVVSGGLQAFKEIKWKVYVGRLGQPVATLITMVIFYLLGWHMEALSFSAIGGYFCSVLIGQIVLSKIVKRFTGDTPPRYTPRIWAGIAMPLLFSGLILNIAGSADILFISIFATPAQAGIYIAAERVSHFVLLPYNALNMIFLPLIVEYYANGKHEQLASMFKLVTKWSLSLSLPVFLCCLVFHDTILGIFGPQYTTGWLALVILCFGNFVCSGTGVGLQLLTITRRLRDVSIISIISIILLIGLSFILVPRFYILGAALAAALVDVIINVLCTIEVYWIMKLHPYRRDVYKPLLSGGVASLVGILLVHFVHLQRGHGFFVVLEQLSLIIPFVLVYILVLLLLRLSEEDRIVFHAVLARFGRQKSTNAV